MLLAAPANYFPFLSGKYAVSPSLKPLETNFGNGAMDHRIFQIDRSYSQYIENKQACRKENIAKYYGRERESPETLQTGCRFLARQMATEYPKHFSYAFSQGVHELNNYLRDSTIRWSNAGELLGDTKYHSVFDALASQVPEDLAIWQASDGDDYISTIHLCSPNHWAPSDKIGKPFSAIHAPVAGMDKLRQSYRPMLSSLLQSKTRVRFAWGLSTDCRLNHHPQPPPDWEESAWRGREFDSASPSLYVRTERQTLTGFPEVQAVLFTIRTYFTNVSTLNIDQKLKLAEAIDTMSEASLRYKGIHRDKEKIVTWLTQ